MNLPLFYQLLENHRLKGELRPGEEITLAIDQTLTQDSTGTMVYLQLEALDPPELKTQLSVAYIDHNMLQSGFENADDHAFIKSVADRRGVLFSKPGGGICHQVHLERFAKPGMTLIGSDSHTPTAGGLGAVAIGAGGLDVAVAMAKGYYHLPVPKIYRIHLKGSLPSGCNGKDVILEVLRRLTVKGGVGYVMEYTGEGVSSLSVTDRATICNMGAELGATTSIFPSDERTRDFLRAHGREEDFIPLETGHGLCHEEMELDLSALVPLVAQPHMPDRVVPVTELAGLKVDQVAIGSCTNSSYTDMMKVSAILKDRHVAEGVDLVISPGSANILRLLAENGALATFVAAGARILESACGPCIGMGQSPKTDAISLRSFNRNFKGRSGTMSAGIYLVSPETAAASAVTGTLTDPRSLDVDFAIAEPASYGRTEHYFLEPSGDLSHPVVMGPNIKPFPIGQPLEDTLAGHVLLKAGDHVTTDDIVPSHAKLLPFRSNVPHLSRFAFSTLTDDFYELAQVHDGGFIVGGENYGQGSSREHAALVPLYLNVKAVIAKSFARIHRGNLINAGILPLVWEDPDDWEKVDKGHLLTLDNVKSGLDTGRLQLEDRDTKETYPVTINLSPREREILLAGGYLNYVKSQE